MNDDDYAVLLLRPLDIEPAGPSRIDVAKAMREGQRNRRVRTWSAGTALTAALAGTITGGVLVLSPATPAPQPELPVDPVVPGSCTGALLPIGGAKSAEVRAGDPSGTYLVGSTEPWAGNKHAVLVWRDGKLIANVTPKGSPPIMWDINGSGVAVGGTDGVGLPYFYRDGKVSRLKGSGRGIAINEAGVIAGDHEDDGEAFPQRWASPDAEPELMTMPDGATGGRVWDIAEDGTVIVSLYTARMEEPFLWHADGSVEPLKAPPKSKPESTWVQPIALHFGWLYAEVREASSGPSAGPASMSPNRIFRYHLASGTTQVVSDEQMKAQVPAPTNAAGFMDYVPRVFVGKEVLDLPPVLGAKDDGFTVDAISEDASIVAGSRLSMLASEDPPPMPVIWRCR